MKHEPGTLYHILKEFNDNATVEDTGIMIGKLSEKDWKAAIMTTTPDNHIIDTVTTDNSVYFKGAVAHLDTNADNVAVYSNGSSNSQFTSTDTGFLDITFWAYSTTIWYVVGSVVSATAPAFADQ